MHNCRKASDIITGVISNRQEAEQCHLLSEIVWFIGQLACVSECHSHVYPSLENEQIWTTRIWRVVPKFEGKSINYHKSDVLHKRDRCISAFSIESWLFYHRDQWGQLFSDMGSKTTRSIPCLKMNENDVSTIIPKHIIKENNNHKFQVSMFAVCSSTLNS